MDGKPVEIKRPFLSWYLTRYVSQEILMSFLGGTSVALLIMLLFQAVRLMEFVVVHQVGLLDVGKLCVFMGMSFLPLAAPIAFLFAVMMGISRANSEGEILALQVNGISLRQIFTPIGLFSIVVFVGVLYTSLYTVPKGNRSFELLYSKLGNERVISTLKPGVFTEGFYGLVLFTEHIVPLKNELKRIFLYDRREEAHPLAITAQAGILKNQMEKGMLTLRLTDGSIHMENPQGEMDSVQQKIDFDVYDINLELGEQGDSWRAYSPPSYDLTQLTQRIQETVHDVPQHRQLLVEYHRRFSMAFSVIVFALLGFSIGILSQRGIRSSALVLCMVVALGYWMSYLGANALAVAGWVPAWLGIWSPNVVFTGVAALCYRRYP
jgi:lipopolysaccharide export system permease protein